VKKQALPRILFWVRASESDGLGHLVRSLLVLDHIKHTSDSSLIVIGDSSGTHLLENSEVRWNLVESELSAIPMIRERSPSLIVFDMLTISEPALKSLPTGVLKVSLSSIFDKLDQMDHLFHRTTVEPPSWKNFKKFPTIHKGLKYSVLPQWLKPISTRLYEEHLNEDQLSVAISMGGSDAPNRTLQLLNLLGKNVKKLVIWVALGNAYRHSYTDLIDTAAQNRHEIILIKSNESMWRVLKNASLVLCAGGLTTYEAAHIGIPALNILQKKNWNYLFEELTELNACVTLPPGEKSLRDAVDIVGDLRSNRSKLLEMHKSTQNVIPKNGAKAIAETILDLI